MQRKGLLFFAFVIVILMAIGGGNRLRHWMYPEEAPAKNQLFTSLGNSIKGIVRSNLGIKGPDPTDRKLVLKGSGIYTDYCAACHGQNLEGQPNWRQRKKDGTLPAPPHDASGHTWHHPDKLIFDYTKLGGQALAPKGFKSGMPAFKDTLTDGDIWAVLSFIKSRWSKEVQERQAGRNPKD